MIKNPVFDAVDLMHWAHEERYKFLMASVIPRPIALVTTIDEAGVVNAAPFSSFVVLSVDPPMLGVSIAKRDDGSIKDTYRLIKANREFVIHSVDSQMVRQVQACGDALGPGLSEIEHAGLSLLPSVRVRPPRIAEAPLHFECVLRRIEYFGNRQSALVVGEVIQAHSRAGLVRGHRIDHLDADILGRIGGGLFCRTTLAVKPE